MPPRTRALLLCVLGLLGAAAVLLVGPWGGWTDSGARRGSSASEQAGLEAPPARSPALQGRDGWGARSTGSETPRYAPGEWPSVLAAADRERDLFGVVVDGEGRAVSGARVSTLLYPWRAAGLMTLGRYEETAPGPAAVTGADGAFRLPLEPGQAVTLQVEAAGFAPAALEDRAAGERVRVQLGAGVVARVTARMAEGQPAAGARISVGASGALRQRLVTDADGRAVSAPLAVAVGGVASVSVEVPVQPVWGWASTQHPVPRGAREVGVALTLTRARTLTGRVTDAATGRPVPGASVGLGWTHQAPVTADADGRYVQPAVPSDGYQELSVRAPGYSAQEQRFGERAQVDFALEREVTLTGRAVDGLGRPLADVRVVANGWRLEGSVQTISFSDALSGPDGAFTLTGLRASLPHEVVLRHPGFGRANVGAPAVQAPGGRHDLGDVVLSAGRALAGRVKGSAGEARLGVEVTLMGPQEPRATDVDSDYGRTETARTDDLGRFRFADLGPGRYLLRALEREPISASRSVTLADADVLDLTLLLPRGRRLRLVPLDAAGAPVLDFRLRYRWDGGARETWVSSAGDLDLMLPEGACQVVLDAEASRQDLLARKGVAVADDATEVEVRFPGAEMVGGLLLDAAGRGLPLARVLVRRGERVVGSTWTEADGAFLVGFAGDGAVDVAFEGVITTVDEDGWELDLRKPLEALLPGVAPGSRGLRLTARATLADGVLLVRVLDPHGLPAPGVGATLSPAVTVSPMQATTDAAGFVRFERLPPGAYAVRLRVPEGQREAWFAPEVSGLRPRAAAHEARLKVPRLLGVQTRRPDDTPFPKVWVTAESEGRQVSQGSTDAEGRVTLPLDPDGAPSVDVEAWASDEEGGHWHAEPTQVPAGEGPVVLRLSPHDGVVR